MCYISLKDVTDSFIEYVYGLGVTYLDHPIWESMIGLKSQCWLSILDR